MRAAAPRSAPPVAALALSAALLACAPKEPDLAQQALEDVNPGSPSFGELISPNDLRGQVSAWYFAHAT